MNVDNISNKEIWCQLLTINVAMCACVKFSRCWMLDYTL